MATPSDLTSVAAVQAWLGQTSDGELLGGLISQVSRAILAQIGRPCILPMTYVEIFDGAGRSDLTLSQWPVVAIESLVADGVAIAAAQAPAPGVPRPCGYSLEAVDPAPPGRMQSLTLMGGRFPFGRRNVAATYVAGYQVGSEAANVPSGAPYQISAQQPFGAWASDVSVAYADGAALMSVASPVQSGQYCVSGGAYAFSAQDAGRAVLLTYGYVPFDLAQAAIEWTAERYAYKSRLALRSKSLGGQETAAYDLSAVPPFVATALQPYRRIVSPC